MSALCDDCWATIELGDDRVGLSLMSTARLIFFPQ
jgi:hypothetical protein